jgi:hypothetical protein
MVRFEHIVMLAQAGRSGHSTPTASSGPAWRDECAAAPHARIDDCLSDDRTKQSMDIEQVNAIGTLLADLSARTEQLRGYL